MSAVSGRVCAGMLLQRVGGGGVRATELDVAASRVAQGVHGLGFFPVTVAVTQQDV